MIFVTRKSTFYNTLAEQKSIISFSLFSFLSYSAPFCTKRTGKIASIQPSGATTTGVKTYRLSARCFQRSKYPESKKKSFFYSNATLRDILPTPAILPGAETSPVTSRPTVCFPLPIFLQHEIITVSLFLLPSVVLILL